MPAASGPPRWLPRTRSIAYNASIMAGVTSRTEMRMHTTAQDRTHLTQRRRRPRRRSDREPCFHEFRDRRGRSDRLVGLDLGDEPSERTFRVGAVADHGGGPVSPFAGVGVGAGVNPQFPRCCARPRMRSKPSLSVKKSSKYDGEYRSSNSTRSRHGEGIAA